MNRSLKVLLTVAVVSVSVTILALGKGKPGPLSGAWACIAHGTDQGDINYMYNLAQDGEKITGSFAEAADSGEKSDITEGSYKDKKLNLTFTAHNGTVNITGTMTKKNAMSGDWSHSGGASGKWDCTKGAAKMAAK